MVQLPHQHGKNPSYVLEDMPKDGDFSAVSEIFHSVSDPKRRMKSLQLSSLSRRVMVRAILG